MDLTNALTIEDGAYSAVVCSGTFLQGRVGPEASRELCRVLSAGGCEVRVVGATAAVV